MRFCLENCSLNEPCFSLASLRSRGDADMYTLVAKERKKKDKPIQENYKLAYCPVGNNPAEATVILVGKTPGLKTLDKFMGLMRENHNIEDAAFKSVYSHMKDSLFRMLNTKTRFFDYMELVAPLYWKSENKASLWSAIFNDYESSQACGIQLTQACDCCIHTSDSKEPTDEAMREIEEKDPGCLFSSFIITDKLELIIFLDSPSADGRYHPEYQFLQTEGAKELVRKNIAITSFPHPSKSSPATNEKIWNDPKTLKSDYPNVFRAVERTSKIIEELIKSHAD